jgi:hypothetical protein
MTEEMKDRAAARATSVVARRAIWRLDLLEWVGLAGAAGVAILGGAIVASLLAGPLGIGFRAMWILASLVLLVVPGTIVLIRSRADSAGRGSLNGHDDG